MPTETDELWWDLASKVVQATWTGGAQRFGDTAARLGEQDSDVEALHSYGFAYHPMSGMDCTLLSVEEGQESRVAIGVSPAKGVPELGSGEVAMYSLFGQTLTFRDDSSATLEGPSGASVTIDAVGNVTVTPSAAGVVRLGGDGAADDVVTNSRLQAELTAIGLTINPMATAFAAAFGILPGGPVLAAVAGIQYVPLPIVNLKVKST